MYDSSYIIGLRVHHLTFRESIDRVLAWGFQHQQGFICFANVHMTIEAYDDPSFQKELDKAKLVLPDGKPIALACNWLYKKKQERVSGMDFMPALLQQVGKLQGSIFLYGSTEEVLQNLQKKIQSGFPGVIVAGAISPPFRKISEAEIADHINTINISGAHFVLVALGCPKQEKWMAVHYKKINALLLGVGGAFPVVAGLQKRSPVWMQKLALEWLFRLIQEPGRMFKRYLYTNTRFVWILGKEIIKYRLAGSKIRPANNDE